jgi:hypothetical protein
MFAAAAVISIAASIPVTVNGWGIRELMAVYVLGKLGVAAVDAVAVSVLIGLCSTIVIVAVSPLALRKTSDGDIRSVDAFTQTAKSVYEVEKASAWILSMTATVLVFFQVHVELPGSLGPINLNMADPFAILALAAVSIHVLSVRRVPLWRVQNFNIILASISVMILVGFLRGVSEVGVTQWALAGRVFGWVVLLGFISCGYLIVADAGAHGLRRLSETMIATGVVIVVLQVILRMFVQWGGAEMSLAQNFEGYAANRNAFVFQMLVCIAFVLGYSSVRARHQAVRAGAMRISSHINWKVLPLLLSLLLGILLLGLILSGSRAGWLVGTSILLIAWGWRFADRRTVALGLLFAIALWGMTLIASAGVIQSATSSSASDHLRWESITRAFDLWMQSPIMGAGLGVFIEKSPLWFGYPVVIHSTPVWVLAEFGVIGAAVFGWAFFCLVRSAVKLPAGRPAYRTLAMLLLGFAGFCLAHEIFYQRIFWLALGAILALSEKEGGLLHGPTVQKVPFLLPTRLESPQRAMAVLGLNDQVSIGVGQGIH